MMSATALTVLIWLALAACMLTPVLLLAMALNDLMKEKLW